MNNSAIKLFHNPRCSKSRQTLALLEERGLQPEIIPYLDTPPSAAELSEILTLLKMEPRELMRTGESAYAENKLGDTALSREALIAAMVANPILIERPIVVSNGRAVLGRPPESVLDIIALLSR